MLCLHYEYSNSCSWEVLAGEKESRSWSASFEVTPLSEAALHVMLCGSRLGHPRSVSEGKEESARWCCMCTVIGCGRHQP